MDGRFSRSVTSTTRPVRRVVGSRRLLTEHTPQRRGSTGGGHALSREVDPPEDRGAVAGAAGVPDCIWGSPRTHRAVRPANSSTSSTSSTKVGYPVEDTVQAVQQERRQTLVYLADPRGSDALAAAATSSSGPPTSRRQVRAQRRRPRRCVDDLDRRARRPARPRSSTPSTALGAPRARSRRTPSPAARRLEPTTASSTPATTFLAALHGLDERRAGQAGPRPRRPRPRPRMPRPRGRADGLGARRRQDDASDDPRAFSDLVAERTLHLRAPASRMLPADGPRQSTSTYWNEHRRPRRCAAPRTGSSPPAARAGTARRRRRTLGRRGRARSSTTSPRMSNEAGDRYQDRVAARGHQRPRPGRRRRRPRPPRPARLGHHLRPHRPQPRPRPAPAAQGGPRGRPASGCPA